MKKNKISKLMTINKKNLLIFFLGIFGLTVFAFQNCSPVDFTKKVFNSDNSGQDLNPTPTVMPTSSPPQDCDPSCNLDSDGHCNCETKVIYQLFLDDDRKKYIDPNEAGI